MRQNAKKCSFYFQQTNGGARIERSDVIRIDTHELIHLSYDVNKWTGLLFYLFCLYYVIMIQRSEKERLCAARTMFFSANTRIYYHYY